MKYTRTVLRVPLKERWSSDNLQWVATVPWNKGIGDKEVDGDMPEFDVKAGPGRNLTEEEKADIVSGEAPRIVHRAHLRKTDFEKHGFTDRCPGCSAIFAGSQYSAAFRAVQRADGEASREGHSFYEREGQVTRAAATASRK